MKTYHKIQTVYKRDPDNMKCLLRGEYSKPEFEYLAQDKWVFTEKVDGTNIRVMFKDGKVTFGGKSDNAMIPVPLTNRLTERFFDPTMFSILRNAFPDCDACLYGEGYGAKIQKGSGNYRHDQDFVLFDVKVGDWWLKRDDVQDVANKLGLDVVPIIGGRGTLDDMTDLCAIGFKSQWGPFLAEGIVARPVVELFARNGERIITKLKHRDFA